LRERDLRQFGERLDVDRPLEIDHFPHRLPPRRPAPLIELRLVGAAEIERDGLLFQSQQEPALLLPDAHGLLVATDVARRQPIAQPARALAHELDIRLAQADLLVQFAVQRLLQRLAFAYAALGKLPPASAGPATEKHLAIVVHQDDADIGAESV